MSFDLTLKPLRDAGPWERTLRLAAAVATLAAIGLVFWVGGDSVAWSVLGVVAIVAVVLWSPWRRHSP
jgi:predicted lysophospholipase L1 biosynthesis ABC-type transport system permease subunit